MRGHQSFSEAIVESLSESNQHSFPPDAPASEISCSSSVGKFQTDKGLR